MDVEKPDYENDPAWADVVPIPQNEGGPNPLAAIAYTEEYSTAMSYLRAVMAVNDQSRRILTLTAHIISMNPAHYTVWLYRAATLEALGDDPMEEIAWLNDVTPYNLKNYQIWHHREVIVSRLKELPKDEIEFIAETLIRDAKNYHVWSYRHWLVKHFGLWPDISESGDKSLGESGLVELNFTSDLLKQDVRNNSAWNHRFFILFGRQDSPPPATWVYDSQIAFAKQKISMAPQNVAAWNYLRGVVKHKKRQGESTTNDALNKKPVSLSELEDFAKTFAAVNGPVEDIRSSHALELLAEIWGEGGDVQHAKKALQILADDLEPIRKGYWHYQMQRLPAEGEAAA